MKLKVNRTTTVDLNMSMTEFVALYDTVMLNKNGDTGPKTYREAHRSLRKELFTIKDGLLSDSWPDQSTWNHGVTK